MIQDIILMFCVFGLGASLIPTIRGHHKPAIWTSIMSAILIFVMMVTFITLGLWLSAIAEGISALAWIVLAIQKRRLQKGS